MRDRDRDMLNFRDHDGDGKLPAGPRVTRDREWWWWMQDDACMPSTNPLPLRCVAGLQQRWYSFRVRRRAGHGFRVRESTVSTALRSPRGVGIGSDGVSIQSFDIICSAPPPATTRAPARCWELAID